MQICDLHTHTNCSDGSLTPRELVQAAKAAGLAAIALTDHNTVSGLPEFMAAGEGSGVETVPGIEFSTEFEDRELHILALYVEEEYYTEITDILKMLMEHKQEQNRELVENLARVGILVDYDALRAASETGNINRAHIAMAMVEGGYVRTRQEAFQLYLNPERGYYRPPVRLHALNTVRYIRRIGAVPVLAHPCLSFKEQAQLERFLEQAVPQGLKGMEVLYSENDRAATEASWETARKFGLLPSGGSDFHGTNKPHIQLGVGRGDLQIPLDFLEALKNSR